jgi:hypothetical protein
LVIRDLLRLNVGRNHLNEFPRDAIATLKNLNQLDLSENKIGLLKPGDFLGELTVHFHKNYELKYTCTKIVS